MSLYTRMKLHSYIWKEPPIYTYFIRLVESLANEGNQPTMDDRYPLLECSLGQNIDDNEQLFPVGENENISDDNETNEDYDGFQSREANDILIHNESINDNYEDKVGDFYINNLYIYIIEN